MDGEWSDDAAAASPSPSPTLSGGEAKVGAAAGDGGGDGGGGGSVDCPGSPASTAAPAAARSGGTRRSAHKRVVTVPLEEVSRPRPKGVGEGNTPTDSWAWRKYGQKPIKGSPFPRAYYRCSSSKGCPARKQVERSMAEPDKVIVTYSFEHNHSNAVARAAQNRQAAKPKAQSVQPESAESVSAGSHDIIMTPTCAGSGVLVVADTEGAAAAVEVHDDFRWLYEGVSVTSSASPSDVDAADEMNNMYGAMFFGAAATPAPLPDALGYDAGLGALFAAEVGEEDAMFAGLGELPECAMVFRRHAGDALAMAGGVKVEPDMWFRASNKKA